MDITNLCGEAYFDVSPTQSVFLPEGTNTITYTIAEPAATLTWTSTNVYQSNNGPTDPCGTISDILKDVTSSIQTDIDTNIFTFDKSLTPTHQLSIETSDLAKAGVYTLQLIAYYVNHP